MVRISDFRNFVILVLLAMPILMLFNDNTDVFYVNILGLVYTYGYYKFLTITKIGRKLGWSLLRIEYALFGSLNADK